jgi:hypothetical protein
MDRRFVFSANAVGAAAHIRRPENIIIWSQGACAIPTSGGYSRAAVDRASFDDILSFDSIKNQSNGDFNSAKNMFQSLSTSIVAGLSVTQHLTIELLEARLTLEFVDRGNQDDEPRIDPAGTHIRNMRLDGYPVDVVLDTDSFTKFAKFSDFVGECVTNKSEPLKSRFLSEVPTSVSGFKKPLVCTLVKKIETKHPQAEVSGNMIRLPGFGRIFLAELLFTPYSKNLSLLRIQLGSPVGGDLACADIEGGGEMIP